MLKLRFDRYITLSAQSGWDEYCQEPITRSEQLPYYIVGLCPGVFTDHLVFERIRSIRNQKGKLNVIKRQIISSTKSSYIFSDSGHVPVPASRVKNFHMLSTPTPSVYLRTVYDWITDENLTVKGNDLSKSVLSDVQSTWLRRKLKPLVQSRGEDSITAITSYRFCRYLMVKIWGVSVKVNEIKSCAILGVLASSTGFRTSSRAMKVLI